MKAKVEQPPDSHLAKFRINELLDERGWTMRQLAEATGLSESMLSRVARDHKWVSKPTLEKIAKALGVTVPQLFEASWQEVPVFGVVEEGGYIKPLGNGASQASRVRAPAVYGDLLALMVVGNAVAPRYMGGETILCLKDSVPAAECIGKECVVQIDNGQTMLRFVHQGSAPGKYVLTSHNQPPLLDATIILSRPIVKP